MQTVTFRGQTHSFEQLEALTGPALVSLYNEVAPLVKANTVNRFSDHRTAARRTWGILVSYAKKGEAEEPKAEPKKAEEPAPKAEPKAKPKKAEESAPKAEPKAPKAPREKKAKPNKKPHGMYFNFPVGKPEVQRGVRDGDTLRGRCVELLLKGATFDKVERLVEQFDADKGRQSKHVTRRAYELVRIMHYYLGYGIRHDQETGEIKLYR